MMGTYLDDDADALDGFEFLTMAEAGEVGPLVGAEEAEREEGLCGDRRARGVGAAHPGGPPASGVTETSLELASEEDPDDEA